MAVTEVVHGRPAELLCDAIDSYVGYLEAGTAPGIHRGLPSGKLTFIVTIDDPCDIIAQPDTAEPAGKYRAFVGGLHTTPALISHQGYQHGIQLDLSPLAARPLLGMPASALPAGTVELEDALGAAGSELWERVAEAPTWSDRFAALDQQLGRLVTARRPVSVAPELARAWSLLQRSAGTVTIRQLASEVGWSRRHLSARFRAEFGLSPKTAGRVLRFDRARWMIQGGRRDLAMIAAECGFADQAHMTREFRELCGCPPTQWIAEEMAATSLFDGDGDGDGEGEIEIDDRRPGEALEPAS